MSVKGVLDAAGHSVEIFSEHTTGLDFYLDPSMVDAGRAEHVRRLLQNALKALEKAPTVERVAGWARATLPNRGRRCAPGESLTKSTAQHMRLDPRHWR